MIELFFRFINKETVLRKSRPKLAYPVIISHTFSWDCPFKEAVI
jgi:hypothetical protein